MRPDLAVLLLVTISCSGDSPSSPSSPPTPPPAPTTPPSGGTGSGRLVDIFTDAGIGSAAVAGDAGQTTSDATGSFTLQPAAGGTFNLTITAPGYVERRTRLAVPGPAAALSLIPLSFDLAAFDAMARTHEGQLVRWTEMPNLIVQRNLLDFADDAGGFMVLNESIGDADMACLETRARDAVTAMSGGSLSVGTTQLATSAPGTRVESTTRGSITIWGARHLGGATGRGGISYTIPGLTVAAGVVYLEVAASGGLNQPSCAGNVTILRHEIGHALGYQHVTSRPSVMQPVNAPDVTDFDRQAFTVFYRRAPGNSSPDTDTSSFRANTWGRLTHWVLP